MYKFWSVFYLEIFSVIICTKKTEVNLPLFLQYLQDCELENLEVQQKPALLIVRCVQRRQLVLTYRRKIYMEITNITLDNERVEDHLAWEKRKQATFHNSATGFPTKWNLRNERKNSLLWRVTTQIWEVLLIGQRNFQPIRSTTPIW